MPPKKRSKSSNVCDKEPTEYPDDVQWCLDNAISGHLNFKDFIDKWDILDRNSAQQRFGNILNKYFGDKTQRNKNIIDNYKNWISTADYLRYWDRRNISNFLVKTNLGCDELIDSMTTKRLHSIQSAINAQPESSTSLGSVIPTTSDNSDTTTIVHEAESETTNNNDDTCFEVDDRLITLSADTSIDDVDENPWLFENVDIGRLFKIYQTTVRNAILKHKTLPIESYTHELASLTHVLILCKNQHSTIANKIFSFDILKKLAVSLTSEYINLNLDFPNQYFMTITDTITNLSLSNTTREQVILDFTIMASTMDYGPQRIVRGITNLETELWSTYFDPILSCLVSDPERLTHLRWTNTIPNEKGKCRPDAVISQKPQLDFVGSVGHGEAKIYQGNGNRLSLCMDTLRLAIFNKNTIDDNKLNAAIAFQIHGFNIMFYITRLTAQGIYTFVEIAHLRFPQSLEDLPNLLTLVNIKKLLGINEAFWRLCKKSDTPDVVHAWYKPTLLHLDSIMDTSQDAPRSCVL